MAKLRIGIIGAGGFAQTAHIANFERIPDVQIAALADTSEDVLRRVANRHQIPKVFTDYQQVLREDLDAVSVCLPNAYHAPVTVAALQAGKHVLCEKPMAVNALEAQTMVEAAKKAQKILMVAFQGRFSPEAMALKRIVERGRLGEIYFIEAGYERRRRMPSGKTWHTEKALSGGGALIDLGVHALDLAMWMMGFPKPKQALGSVLQKFASGAPGTKNDVEDFATAYVLLENGASIVLKASWASNIKQDRSTFEVIGTKGGATMGPLALYTQDDGQLLDVTPVITSTEDPNRLEIRHFVDCVRAGRQPIITPEQSLVTTRVVDAIYKSGQSGGAVAVTG
ncbi:MAG: Gfo/Idh/MocA family oxidoreductase [Planctomycetes bacterium]|nr:Gfo/Idh/MocA family oxidoreductase [Planctomycetota bacterium]